MPYHDRQSKNTLRHVFHRIQNSIYRHVAPLKIEAWVTPEPVPYGERMSGAYKELHIGDTWGKLWDCAWFRFTGRVPDEAAGKKVVLLIDLNGEACVVDENGNPYQGLTTINSEFDRSLGLPGKRVVELYDPAQGGEAIEIWADAGNNDLFGRLPEGGRVKEAFIAVCNEPMRQLYYDFEVLMELLDLLPEGSARHRSILRGLLDAADQLHAFTENEAERAREVLRPVLEAPAEDRSLTVSAIGHAHIDLAWLWPIRETIRKGARTFSTVMRMMERYPEYVFGASQPQLYVWMKEHYPALYEEMKARIAEGRFEVQGAMWVEADTNVSGGEALVRQILYGKRFFRDEFGLDMEILWLPDVFGYSAALPQLLRKAGVKYFQTQKLSWNEHNMIPHHTFHWEGIDGSRVLAHMPPEETYNSSGAPRAVVKARDNYLDKGVSDRLLLLFGIGDGGGGPGEEHLERMRRIKDLSGLVPVRQEKAIDFFRALEKNAHKYAVWHGELYLEKHQGTYTSQGRTKWYNRKMELALRECELASVQAMLAAGHPYPAKDLERIWKEMLLYQFHDILPGSSITRVYQEAEERYAALLAEVEALIAEARAAWAAAVVGVGGRGVSSAAKSGGPSGAAAGAAGASSTDSSAGANVVLVSNSLSWPRSEWVRVDGRWYFAEVPPMAATVVDVGASGDSAGDAALEAGTPADANNGADITTQSRAALPERLSASTKELANDLLRVTFDPDGSIASIYDIENDREVLAPGARGNVLAVYRDPGDAWDFPIDYDSQTPERFRLVRTEAALDGPKAVVTQEYEYGSSRLKQQIIVTAGSRRIDFVTEVDWHERDRMLRTSFPVNVFTREATCEIQFGSVKRPTHRNTSWDMAKYEVCGQKWVDLSQRDYGVALLNDSKYGHKVLENTIDLNLLRSPGYPDPEADKGQHRFTYALYPHRGDHVEGGVVRVGYELNVPLQVTRVTGVAAAEGEGLGAGAIQSEWRPDRPFVVVDAPNVVVEAVKKAEDSDDIVIRLYECHGAGVRARVSFGFETAAVRLVNLMEEPLEDTQGVLTGESAAGPTQTQGAPFEAPFEAPVGTPSCAPQLEQVGGNEVLLSFRPFEVHTLMVSVAR